MSSFNNSDAKNFKSFIDSHKFFFIAGHKEPDGDCIASCLGIASILDYFQKPYQLLSAGPFKRAEIKKFENKFSSEMEFQTQDERNNTGLIITDCSELHRLGDIDGDLKGLDTFIIDHHKTAEIPDNASSFIDSSAPACSYLIQLFYETLIGPLPLDVAEIIFFGFCTDTGFFKFLDNNSYDVFQAVSRLVKSGVNPRETYKIINSGRPYSTRKLLGIMLNRAEQYLNGKLVITYETMNDTKLYGQEGRDSDSLYQLLLSSEGVEAVVFLRQETESTCTGGFRSQDKIDVSTVASKFGGGGHKNAAGMATEGKLETLIPAIVKEFARIM
ncbi:MAG: bifunctional oligoribonuclease/PAP phosphatase NrnA, partial [Treponema sp.]|nr:bifunctional oligoribonuclease/PAP phosphatase NrnA [Treponema sp.]